MRMIAMTTTTMMMKTLMIMLKMMMTIQMDHGDDEMITLSSSPPFPFSKTH